MPGDLDRLGAELDKIQSAKKVAADSRDRHLKDAENMGRGVRAGIELTAPIIAGGGLGWLIDQGMGTRPFGLIVMLLLGVSTGFYNVWRATQNAGSGVGFSELRRREKDAKTLPERKNQS